MIDFRQTNIKFNTSDKLDVLYLMTKTFRTYNNYSLNLAINKAKENDSNLEVLIILPDEEPRQKKFLSEMISDISKILKGLDISAKIIETKQALDNINHKCSDIFIDKPYLIEDLEILDVIKEHYPNSNLFTVDSNVFVPTQVTSRKEEYSARTIRNKIWSHINDYNYIVLDDTKHSIGQVKALEVLNDFIDNKLADYHLHNDPSKKLTSLLSPYLKYGIISPVTIYKYLITNTSPNKEAFLEELIIRRELAYNFVYYNKNYYKFSDMTYEWAHQTMKNHKDDIREYIYDLEDYLNFRTHDKYFNAAMKEMIYLGRMHSYMRMYWCKKIIEWSRTYEEAYDIAIYLNNKYFLDGNTPNGYCGVAWCFGKHDRAWTEREIFGKLRYMNANGLIRKFDIEQYIKNIEEEVREKL